MGAIFNTERRGQTSKVLVNTSTTLPEDSKGKVIPYPLGVVVNPVRSHQSGKVPVNPFPTLPLYSNCKVIPYALGIVVNPVRSFSSLVQPYMSILKVRLSTYFLCYA